MELLELRQKVIEVVLTEIDQKIQSLEEAIDVAQKSRDMETKSTAGDKYETGRAMAQIEIDKYGSQLSEINKSKQLLNQMNTDKVLKRVTFGSLVITSDKQYLIGIGHGAVTVEGKSFFVISLASPIGKSMLGKSSGDEVVFRGLKFKIEDLC